MEKILILLSGGLDSATCLGLAVDQVGSENVTCLNAYYGQRLDKEMDCAKALTGYYGVEYIEMDISPVMQFSNCSLLKASSLKVTESSYQEQIKEKAVIDSCVPFRNGVFLSIAAAIAESRGIDEIWYGAHDDDYAYPDCSKDFIDSMTEAVYAGTSNHVKLVAPLKGMKKADIVKKGLQINVPYGMTWSCYKGGEKPCCKCASCIDRINAFKANGVEDPTI